MFVEEFNIYVDLDSMYPKDFEHPRAFFLTHTHNDHLQGFFGATVSDYLQKNSSVKIYMTELSFLFIKYMRSHSKFSWILDHIKILTIGTNIVSLPADPDRGVEELLLTVKVLPAAHSLGSVMLLFKTPSLRVLFTGDFRISESDVEKYTDFQDRDLDALYVDTTFLNGSEFYPKRSDVVDSMIEEIKKWLDGGSHRRVGISTSAATGYEDVFNQIYHKLGIKVSVFDADKREFYRSISEKVPGVTESPESPIHLCSYRAYGYHSRCTPSVDDTLHDFLTVRLSAMKWRLSNEDCKSYGQDNKTLSVCYATHCSSSELKYFINYFNCPRIIGHPYEYVSVGKSPECKDVFGNRLKKKYFSSTEKFEDTVVPAKVVKNLLTSMYSE